MTDWQRIPRGENRVRVRDERKGRRWDRLGVRERFQPGKGWSNPEFEVGATAVEEEFEPAGQWTLDWAIVLGLPVFADDFETGW